MYYCHFFRDLRLEILTTGLVTPLEQYAVIDDIDFSQFLSFLKNLMNHVYIKCLIQGNVTEKEALKIILDSIEPLKCGKLSPDMYPHVLVHELPDGEKCCRVKNFNNMDVNSVITNYYQSGLFSLRLSTIIELFLVI